MFNFGLVKTTLFYMLTIALVFGFKVNVEFGVAIFGLGLLFLLKRRLAFLSVACCVVGFTLFQFNSIFPTKESHSNGYCKINKVIDGKYKSKLFCSCTDNNEDFKSLVYYKSEQFMPKVGETYFVNKGFVRIESQALFGEFSYQDYLSKKGIYFESKDVKPYHLRKIANQNVFSKSQTQILASINDVLNRYFNSEDVAILKALCFGDKSEVSKDRLETFRQAGLMHIIAVSGMHVGIIQGILLFILGRIFGKSPKSLRFQQGVVVLLLIGFAWLCQFSPSVVRSVFMFSVLFYSFIYKRVIQSLHVLFLTAFVILLFQPLQLFDVGFQFSYLATLGLILSINLIGEWVKCVKNVILNWALQLCLISIVAQFFLSPLLFYYFGEIPVFFLLFNIPGFLFVAIILLLVLLFFLSYALGGFFTNEIAFLITYCIDSFNRILGWIDHFSNLYFQFKLNSLPEVFCYGLILIFSILLVFKSKWRAIKYVLIGVLVLIGLQTKWNFDVNKKTEILVWNTNSDQNITFKKGNQIQFYSTYIPVYSQRFQNYSLALNSKIIHQKIQSSTTELNSYLGWINKSDSDSAICVLFKENPSINQFLDVNFKHVEYLYFGQPSYNSKDSNIQYLSYGPTALDINKNIIFYP